LLCGQFVLQFEDEFDIVNTGGVHGPGWLRFLWEESEGVAVGEGFRDEGVVLVGFDKSEVTTFFR
jgi:hypothetical protein